MKSSAASTTADEVFVRLCREWNERKAALGAAVQSKMSGANSYAKSNAIEIPEHIVTSFTDQAPIHGWEPKHALRELWQNFRDGLRERFCTSPNLEIVMKQHDGKYFYASFGKEPVGCVDLRVPNKLSITQFQCILGIEALQLASFKSDKDGSKKTIGGHGEGFKVGINLLLRHGYTVKYKMPFTHWVFSLRNAYTDKCKNMCVDIISEYPADCDGLVIEIEGPNAHQLFDPEMDLQLTKDLRMECDCKSGGIYSCHPSNKHHHGRVYCRGLFVACDEDFRHLQLVVNLNTNIARDRHLLPGNTWTLIKEILEEASEKKSMLMAHLLDVCKNLSEKVLTRSLPYIKPPLRKFIAKDRGVNENDVIFIQAQETSHEHMMKVMGKVLIYDAGALADPIDVDALKKEYVEKAPAVKVKDLSPSERVLFDVFCNFSMSVRLNINRSLFIPDGPNPGSDLIIKEVPRSFFPSTVPSRSKPSYNLQIGRFSFSNEDNLMDLVFIVTQNLLYESKDENNRLKAKIIKDFIRDPFKFRPIKYTLEDDPVCDPFTGSDSKKVEPNEKYDSKSEFKGINSNGNKSTKLSTAGGGGGGGSFSDLDFEYLDDEEVTSPGGTVYTFSSTPNKPAKASPNNNDKNNAKSGSKPSTSTWTPKGINNVGDLLPDEKLLTSNFKGVPDKAILDKKGEGDDDEAQGGSFCTPFEGHLIPQFVDDNVVYFSEAQLPLLKNSQFMASLTSSLPSIISNTESLRENIMRALKISSEAFTVMNVVIDDMTLAFTYQGGIYLNCKPLVGANQKNLRTSIYFSLIHELTHRSHHGHNTFFADEYGKLVYLSCHCLKNS